MAVARDAGRGEISHLSAGIQSFPRLPLLLGSGVGMGFTARVGVVRMK